MRLLGGCGFYLLITYYILLSKFHHHVRTFTLGESIQISPDPRLKKPSVSYSLRFFRHGGNLSPCQRQSHPKNLLDKIKQCPDIPTGRG